MDYHLQHLKLIAVAVFAFLLLHLKGRCCLAPALHTAGFCYCVTDCSNASVWISALLFFCLGLGQRGLTTASTPSSSSPRTVLFSRGLFFLFLLDVSIFFLSHFLFLFYPFTLYPCSCWLSQILNRVSYAFFLDMYISPPIPWYWISFCPCSNSALIHAEKPVARANPLL